MTTTLSGTKPVNPYNLLVDTENFYKNLIAYGIDNVKITKDTITQNALDIPMRERAISDLIIRLIYRDEDYNSGDLEQIFGIDNTRLDITLADCEYFCPTSYGTNLAKLLTVSEIIDSERCIDSTVISVSNLKMLVESKTSVNPWLLLLEVKNLYYGIKAFGVENLNVSYTIGKNESFVIKAIELSERCRGVADLIVRLIYRWEDYNSKRLESRFGITTDLEVLLDDLKIFNPKSYSLNMTAFLTVADVITAILGEPSSFDSIPTNITALYKLTELHQFDVDPKKLLYAADSLYLGIKAVGIENLCVFYQTDDNKKKFILATDLSEKLRSIADLIVRLYYRFNNRESERLDKRFGLKNSIKFYLHDLDVFSYDCTLNVSSVYEIIEIIKKMKM